LVFRSSTWCKVGFIDTPFAKDREKAHV
jgi:hypothetical protein